jgi:hypothetical protein
LTLYKRQTIVRIHKVSPFSDYIGMYPLDENDVLQGVLFHD